MLRPGKLSKLLWVAFSLSFAFMVLAYADRVHAEECFTYSIAQFWGGVAHGSSKAEACATYAANWSTQGTIGTGFGASVRTGSGSVVDNYCNVTGTNTTNCYNPDVYGPGYPPGCGVGQPASAGGFIGATPVECPPPEDEECDPAMSGARSTAKSAVALGASVCDSVSHCVLTRTSMATVIGGVEYSGVYENTGQTCSGQPDAPPTAAGESCTTSGDLEICLNPTGGGQCGYVNDDFVCIKNIKSGGCKVLSDGGRVCRDNAGTPPAPDNGTPGVPAAADKQIQSTDAQGNITNYNYYSATTVGGSAREPTPDGSPQGGSSGGVGDGAGEEDEDGSSASGGQGCDSPPSCSGDPILCAQLEQQWLARCPGGASESEIAAAMGPVENVRSEEVDLADAISETGILPVGSAQCPENSSFDFFGHTVVLNFWPMACSAAEGIRPFILIVAYLLAVMILVL